MPPLSVICYWNPIISYGIILTIMSTDNITTQFIISVLSVNSHVQHLCTTFITIFFSSAFPMRCHNLFDLLWSQQPTERTQCKILLIAIQRCRVRNLGYCLIAVIKFAVSHTNMQTLSAWTPTVKSSYSVTWSDCTNLMTQMTFKLRNSPKILMGHPEHDQTSQNFTRFSKNSLWINLLSTCLP